MPNNHSFDPWPALPYADFQPTAYLLHRCVQMIGKLKLHTPFEPHWANVALWLTARGLTTGLIPYQSGMFSIDIDLFDHHITCNDTSGHTASLELAPMSVAEFTKKFSALLKEMRIHIDINLMPQEIPNPIAFDQDTEQRPYNRDLVNAWWRILVSSYHVMQKYHAKFDGETPAIGLMWGTFDLRDARYNGEAVPTTGINAGYIRRNAMNEAQVEAGFWHGNDDYPQAAYYSFIYPQPAQIEKAKIKPAYAHWNDKLMEFVLDYDDLRKSPTPEVDLLAFFETAYKAGMERAKWNSSLTTSGEPV